ncbi:hypothetical protein B0H14DRAFT_3769122 [Mycena olivaceomarginata]|nr:hypothetical protein B0H14DRAFT_3769122 [Mycena olivaceomarginata]
MSGEKAGVETEWKKMMKGEGEEACLCAPFSFSCLAQTIQCISDSPKTTSMRATEKWLSVPAKLNPAFAASIENTYRVYENLVGEPRHSEHFTKITPVEFIMIGILGTDTKRASHEDIRNNGKMYKTMVAFIDRYNGDVTQGEVWAKDAVDGPTAGGASGSKTGAKRKASRAPAEDEDSDDDYTPRKRERASPKKAIALPTPPPSSTSAPAPTSTAPPSTPVPGLDVVRQAKERLAKRLAELVSASTSDAQLSTPNPMPMPFGSYNINNPNANPNDSTAF